MTVTDSKLETYINALTEETTPDVNNDMLMLLDASTGGMKKIKPSTVATGMSAGVGADGWAAADAMTYAAADAPTFTMTCAGDQTGKYSVGMRVKLTQTTVKYFIITAVAYSSSTTITLYGGTDYTLANAAITNPYYSSAKAPLGFPLDPVKWTVRVVDTTDRTQSSPTAGTWYNPNAACQIVVPIGAWRLSYKCVGSVYNSGAAAKDVSTTLSTTNNGASDTDFIMYNDTSLGATYFRAPAYVSKSIVLASKTTYYANAKTGIAGQNNVGFINSFAAMILEAVCAYL